MTHEPKPNPKPVSCPVCQALTFDLDGHQKWHMTMSNQPPSASRPRGTW